jgi:hypothetical protein
VLAYINVAGLLMNLAGVILLFRYGMPFRVSIPGSDILVVPSNDEETRIDRFYRIWGYVGLVLIILGTLFQCAASVMGR